MVKLHKLHKFAGLTAGLVLIILGISGFLINHDKWSFLYTTTFTNVPQTTKDADAKLFEAYWINPEDEQHRIVGGKRGIFESFDGAKTFEKMTSLQCLALKSDKQNIYAATSDGIYILTDAIWTPFALSESYINALSVSKTSLVAIIEKHELIHINKADAKVLSRNIVSIEAEKLEESITLSRFVRDLHYGRALFDGDISLLINDYGGIVISLLGMSGYIIWILIKRKKAPKLTRKLIKMHASWFSILAIVPLLILAVTGIFLDHSKALGKFMGSVTISHSVLPPVYSSLEHDIWSVDYDDKSFRIGNRYGVYKSDDLKTWNLESKGLAYRMIRKENTLYISGMGSSNRIYDGEYKFLKAPFMFRDVSIVNETQKYFATCGKCVTGVPTFEDATLYSLMLTLHDGTFFAQWWIWINDYVSVALIVLLITGSTRWFYKRKKKLL
ncbi:MAG: PepSY-associated TM helix domain-containing protein [Sulfurimonas sp.]|nr:PepSY-associated TM helix domain-containing protein [Sulfurimonas sp.]